MEAARSKCEGDGASDIEALFASAEEAKPPNILAAGAGYYLAARSKSLAKGDQIWSPFFIQISLMR
ncbi:MULTISPECIES: hypothetical protein [Bacillus]|uniref:Uncharacterized protein n=2 Tax=Bacillus cereus group TaxID=86661 RepID=A0A2B0Y8X2_BACAN|nr:MULTISPECIES: hypothetical protein [Bacillus]KZD38559.1 hypothetical protein B4082_1636 [Bacillus cereus]MBJ8060664.1 hypothetical protein [Bacillus cereus]MCU4758245.1 hypothetical protein [Bacillus cereus]MCU5108512.1 hypothetical protein [Bacillus cereus]MDF2018237.1 hypothetical protein [Bacillus sp. Cr_R3]